MPHSPLQPSEPRNQHNPNLDPNTSFGYNSSLVPQQTSFYSAPTVNEAFEPSFFESTTENLVFDNPLAYQPLPYDPFTEAYEGSLFNVPTGTQSDTAFIDLSLFNAKASTREFQSPEDDLPLMPYYETNQTHSGSATPAFAGSDLGFPPLSDALTQGHQPRGQMDG